jgi:glycosyltransferase involved in cell wall biosynthesis
VGVTPAYRELSREFHANPVTLLRDVNRTGERHGRRALLVYLVKAFQLREDDPLFFFHQNLRRCRRIAALLDELGYVVDVAEGGDPRFRIDRPYDLVISDRVDLGGQQARLPPEARKIYLGTTDHHATHNRRLRRRHQALARRRGQEVRLRRLYSEHTPFVDSADAIVALGTEATAGSWRESFRGPIHFFNNHAFAEIGPPPGGRDYDVARRHFLFLASRSQMQKGLDLLLDVFPRHPDLHLHVCSAFEKEEDFCALYHQELLETPNVHPHGWLNLLGPEFRSLAERCAYLIHPSCTEGQAGAVVHGMAAGLIPLVTSETGIDTEDFGLTFGSDSIDEIERVVTEVATRSPAWHREHAGRTRAAAAGKYTEKALVDRWRMILGNACSLAAR